MAHGQITTNVPAELKSAAVNGVVASAEGIFDYNENKTQEELNQDLTEQISGKLDKTEAAELYQPKGNYLTEHQDISGKANVSDVYTKSDIDAALRDKQDTLADSEDVVKVIKENDVYLNFANKTYNSATFSGLGRTYLRRNIVTLEGVKKNVLTQAMVNSANTVYHIQYDYDLNGQSITLPTGCVLEFDGGSLKNGTLNGTNTSIIAGVLKIFDTTLSIGGSWEIDNSYPEWFGKITNNDCSTYIVLASKFGRPIILQAKTYRFNVTIVGYFHLIGRGVGKTYVQAYASDSPVISLDKGTNHYELSSIEIRGITFWGSNTTTYNGVAITFSTNRMGGVRLFDCKFQYFDKCFYKPFGNPYNYIEGCQMSESNYGYYAVGDAGVGHLAHDTIRKCEFNQCKKAAVYINDTGKWAGGTIFDNCITEANIGFDFFVKDYSYGYNPLLIKNHWFEYSRATEDVEIDGVTYPRKSIYLENSLCKFENTSYSQIKLVNSTIYGDTLTAQLNGVVEKDEGSLFISHNSLGNYKQTEKNASVSYVYQGQTFSFKGTNSLDLNFVPFGKDNDINFKVVETSLLQNNRNVTPIFHYEQCPTGKPYITYQIPVNFYLRIGHFTFGDIKDYKWIFGRFIVRKRTGTDDKIKMLIGWQVTLASYENDDQLPSNWVNHSFIVGNNFTATDDKIITLTIQNPDTVNIMEVDYALYQVFATNDLMEAITYVNNNEVIDFAIDRPKCGTSRPTLSQFDAGFQFFDTSLSKAVWWTGTTWVDATGTAV